MLAICTNLCIIAQNLSLEVDCQNPGWLSYLINYDQQQQLKNLKISGYINGTDLQFLRRLNKELCLNGVIDLENANIVSGGEEYYKTYKVNQSDILPVYAFAELDSIQKVILPKSIKGFETTGNDYVYQFYRTIVDTLVINGTMNSVKICYGADMAYWYTRCIYFCEGIENIDFGLILRPHEKITYQVMYLPSTLKSIKGSYMTPEKSSIVVYSRIDDPESVEEPNGIRDHYFRSGTIYVPKGTADKYSRSIFQKMTIIEDIAVEGIEFSDKSISSYIGTEFSLSASVKPEDALHKDVTYIVEDPEIVEMKEDGKFVGKRFGETKIYAYSHNNEFYDVCEIKIFEHTTGVVIQDFISMKVGESVKVVATTLPDETSDNLVTYSSTNNNIATVSNDGTIMAVSQGTTTIIATSVDGDYKAECTVNVIQPVESITLSEHTATLNVGEVLNLNVSINPTNADNKKVKWVSSNEEIAKVEEGKVTAIKAGTATIIATSEDNENANDYCELTVNQPVTGISLNYNTYTMNNIGEVVQLEANVIPEDATNKVVNWKSSNENVCIVSNGTVVAVGYGISVIICTTVDGGYMAICTIEVEDTSAIQESKTDNQNDFQIYDLMGCKVSKTIKGRLYIRNGLKFIAK